MRGFLVGVAVIAGLVAIGFGTLVMIANGLEPTRENVRVELEDDFPSRSLSSLSSLPLESES